MPLICEKADNPIDNSESPAVQLMLRGHKKPITAVAFHPNSVQFVTSSQDQSIIQWKNLEVTPNSRIACSYSFLGHTDIVNCVEYSPNGKIIASCSKDTTVRFWEPSIRGGYQAFKAATSSVNVLNFSRIKNHLITGSNEKSIKLWDVNKCAYIKSYLGHNNFINCAKISPNDDYITSCADDYTLRVWDKRTAQIIHSFVTPKSKPKYISIHSNNEIVAVAMETGTIRIYDIPNRKLQQHYTPFPESETTCVDWHPNAFYLLCSAKNGEAKIIDVMEGRILYTIHGQDSVLNVCKFSSDGEYFVLAGEGKCFSVFKTNFIP